MILRQVVVLMLLLLFLPMTVKAQTLALSLTPDIQSGVAGDTVTFSANLVNNGSTDTFLNQLFLSLPGTNLMGDTSDFLNTPAYLSPGQSWSGAIFDITIDPTSKIGSYLGTATIVGGLDDNASDDLASQSFTVQVVSPAITPESNTNLTSLLGIVVFVILFRMLVFKWRKKNELHL